MLAGGLATGYGTLAVSALLRCMHWLGPGQATQPRALLRRNGDCVAWLGHDQCSYRGSAESLNVSSVGMRHHSYFLRKALAIPMRHLQEYWH